MNVTSIVIIEDEPSIREGITAALRAAGYGTSEAADGEAGLQAALRPGVDLVLLDLMLPKKDGMDVLKQLRQTHPTLPVIILTARGSEEDRVDGLEAGADDYVVKPFSARELVARVEAVLRRSPERPDAVTRLVVGRVTIDLQRREILAGKAPPQALSETECAILSHLAANPHRAVSRDELLTRLWGLSGSGIETRTIDMHIARLRSKLAGITKGAADACIATVRGKGYMLGPGARPENEAGEAAPEGTEP